MRQWIALHFGLIEAYQLSNIYQRTNVLRTYGKEGPTRDKMGVAWKRKITLSSLLGNL